MSMINIVKLWHKLIKIFRRNALEKTLKKQPYTYYYEDIKIEVAKDVFPPDIGFATLDIVNELKKYHAHTALDMGTGTGIIALMMKKIGIKKIIAVDNHYPAIECCKKNLELNPKYKDIDVIHSNLFENIDSLEKFDMIVFNHPYSPASNKIIFGNGKDGGKEICEKFLSQAKDFLNKNGKILMSFSSIFNMENNPIDIAQKLGYKTKTILQKYHTLNYNYIYEFRRK